MAHEQRRWSDAPGRGSVHRRARAESILTTRRHHFGKSQKGGGIGKCASQGVCRQHFARTEDPSEFHHRFQLAVTGGRYPDRAAEGICVIRHRLRGGSPRYHRSDFGFCQAGEYQRDASGARDRVVRHQRDGQRARRHRRPPGEQESSRARPRRRARARRSQREGRQVPASPGAHQRHQQQHQVHARGRRGASTRHRPPGSRPGRASHLADELRRHREGRRPREIVDDGDRPGPAPRGG